MAIKTFTTGETLTASDTNTYLNNGGLVYITSVVPGTGVSSTPVNDCFTATYDNYFVTMTNVTFSVGSTNILCNLNGLTSGYYGSMAFDIYTGSGGSGFNRTNNGAGIAIGLSATGPDSFYNFNIFSPFKTALNGFTGQYYAGGFTGYMGGQTTDTASRTGFTIDPSGSVTMTGGIITVYGYRKA